MPQSTDYHQLNYKRWAQKRVQPSLGHKVHIRFLSHGISLGLHYTLKAQKKTAYDLTTHKLCEQYNEVMPHDDINHFIFKYCEQFTMEKLRSSFTRMKDLNENNENDKKWVEGVQQYLKKLRQEIKYEIEIGTITSKTITKKTSQKRKKSKSDFKFIPPSPTKQNININNDNTNDNMPLSTNKAPISEPQQNIDTLSQISAKYDDIMYLLKSMKNSNNNIELIQLYIKTLETTMQIQQQTQSEINDLNKVIMEKDNTIEELQSIIKRNKKQKNKNDKNDKNRKTKITKSWRRKSKNVSNNKYNKEKGKREIEQTETGVMMCGHKEERKNDVDENDVDENALNNIAQENENMASKQNRMKKENKKTKDGSDKQSNKKHKNRSTIQIQQQDTDNIISITFKSNQLMSKWMKNKITRKIKQRFKIGSGLHIIVRYSNKVLKGGKDELNGISDGDTLVWSFVSKQGLDLLLQIPKSKSSGKTIKVTMSKQSKIQELQEFANKRSKYKFSHNGMILSMADCFKDYDISSGDTIFCQLDNDKVLDCITSNKIIKEWFGSNIDVNISILIKRYLMVINIADSLGIPIYVICDIQSCINKLSELELCKPEFVGFDCEWERGKQKVALIQIADRNMVLLIRVRLLSKIPDELLRFCSNNDIKKCGVNIKNDAEKLKNCYQIKVNECIDLCKYALNKRRKSLEKMCEDLLKQPMLFKQSINHWRWQVEELDHVQISYASDDAMVGYLLYEHFMKKEMESIKNITLP